MSVVDNRTSGEFEDDGIGFIGSGVASHAEYAESRIYTILWIELTQIYDMSEGIFLQKKNCYEISECEIRNVVKRVTTRNCPELVYIASTCKKGVSDNTLSKPESLHEYKKLDRIPLIIRTHSGMNPLKS